MDREHLAYLFFAFHGRIPRKAYWIGTLIFVVASFVLSTLVIQLLGITFSPDAPPDPRLAWLSLIVTLVLLVPGLALLVKRLHDRDRSGWWAVVAYALAITLDALDVAGLAGPRDDPASHTLVLSILLMIVALWLLIESGFLKGTAGDNRYGPDPLDGMPDANYD